MKPHHRSYISLLNLQHILIPLAQMLLVDDEEYIVASFATIIREQPLSKTNPIQLSSMKHLIKSENNS